MMQLLCTLAALVAVLCMYCLWRQKSFSGLKCAFVDLQVLVSCSHPWEVNLWYFGQEAEEELK